MEKWRNGECVRVRERGRGKEREGEKRGGGVRVISLQQGKAKEGRCTFRNLARSVDVWRVIRKFGQVRRERFVALLQVSCQLVFVNGVPC